MRPTWVGDPDSVHGGTPLSASAAWASRAINVAPDGIIAVDSRGHVTDLNDTAERMFAVTRDEVAGRPLGDLIVVPLPPAMDWGGLLSSEACPGAWVLDRPFKTLARRRTVEFPAEVTVARSSNSPLAYTAFVRDLSISRSAESNATQMERLLAAAERLSHVGSWQLDLRTGRALWSDEMYRIKGLEPGETKPSVELLLELAHPGDRERLAAVLSTVVNSPEQIPDEGLHFEYRVVRRDGSVREIRSHGRVESDERGRPALWLGSGQDVTDERLTERELLAHHAVEQALREWESFDEGVVGLLRRLGTALDFPLGSMWVPDAESKRLTSRAFWIAPGVDVGNFDVVVGRSAFLPGEGLAGHAWQSVRPVIVRDLPTDPTCGDRAAAARLGLRGGVAFPATNDDESPLAVLTYYGFDARLPSERLIRTLTAIGRELGRFLGRRGAELGTHRLSPRELEVLQLAAEGHRGPQIAVQLGLSPATVKTHFENIYEKLGVGDRAAAVAYAMRIGLLR
jgi:PAS domain S-box-containing protein